MKEYLAKPDQTIEEHVEKLKEVLALLEEYGYIQDKHLIELVEKACIHHDDGKMNPEFQKRIRNNSRFNSEKELPHNVLSGFLLDKDEFNSEEDYIKVLFAILYHHNYGDPYEIILEKKDFAYELLKDFHVFKIKRRILNDMKSCSKGIDAVKIKGYLHKCDYSASGNYTAEYPNDFLVESLENVKNKWKKYNPHSDWNDLQKFAINKRNENIIMIAQTGMGKTEAGLQWIGNNKGYFVLPLRTAINAIYDRVKEEILLNEDIEHRLSVLHSGSLEYYSRNIQDGEMDLVEYERRGKHLSMPLNISTMDQLFDFVFKYQGYELKLTTLSYSKIVIDEIQMYDPEMLAYLIYGLKKIVEFGGNVAVMTATLSPFLKQLLMDEISFREDNIGVFTNDLIRHNVKTIDCDINPEDIINLYEENKKDGKSNKILVVCNTIKKAQEIYESVCSELSNTVVHLLHSQFTRIDRSEKEEQIIEFGRTYDKDGLLDINSGIWISTSLVEASLDIDFDYLVTELQDLNSLFQRMGRCNRKGAKSTDSVNCFIYLTSSNNYIDKTIFEVSKNALTGLSGRISEKQKMDIINSSMTMKNLENSEYYNGKDGYRMTMNFLNSIEPYKYEKNDKKLRNILSIDIIPCNVYERNENEIRQLEKRLSEDISYIERIDAKSDIMKYSVSIPFFKWQNYQRAIRDGKAVSYEPVIIGKYEKVNIMECKYEEQGFRELDYNNTVREAIFL